jgi:hypothetical protein
MYPNVGIERVSPLSVACMAFVLSFSYDCPLWMNAKKTLAAVSEPDAWDSLFSTATIC